MTVGKRGVLSKIVPFLTAVILLSFLYLTLPLQIAGPTGLAGFSPQDVIVGCATINSSTTLTQNLISNGTCITIANSSISLNCDGFSILYNNASAGGGSGIIAVNVQNITVANCTIRDINTGGSRGFGINLTGVTNSIFRNNVIQTNGTFNNFGMSIFFNSTNNTIQNNTIRAFGTGGTNVAIFMDRNSSSNRIIGNNLTGNGNGGSNDGIDMFRLNNTLIENNTIQASGTDSSHVGISAGTTWFNIIRNNTISTLGQDHSTDCCDYGIFMNGNVHFNNITDNRIVTNGSSANDGIRISGVINPASNFTIAFNIVNSTGNASAGSGGGNAPLTLATVIGSVVVGNNFSSYGDINNYVSFGSSRNILFANNTVRTNGSGGGNEGLRISSTSHSQFIGNRITTSGTDDDEGIVVTSNSQNNTFDSNNITTTTSGAGARSHGIVIGFSGEAGGGTNNGSFFNNTLLDNPIDWIQSSAQSNNNFSNTIFNQPNGSIRFPGLIQVNGTLLKLTKQRLNITFNLAFLNSTNATAFNTSAQITFRNITSADPKPTISFTDSGTFVDCPASICAEDGPANFSGNTYVFNVTQFTAYSSNESGASPSPPPPSAGGGGHYTTPTIGGVKHKEEEPEVELPGCVESWTCGFWRPCTNGRQRRSCSLLKYCNVTTHYPPPTERECSGASPAAQLVAPDIEQPLLSEQEVRETQQRPYLPEPAPEPQPAWFAEPTIAPDEGSNVMLIMTLAGIALFGVAALLLFVAWHHRKRPEQPDAK